MPVTGLEMSVWDPWPLRFTAALRAGEWMAAVFPGPLTLPSVGTFHQQLNQLSPGPWEYALSQ